VGEEMDWKCRHVIGVRYDYEVATMDNITNRKQVNEEWFYCPICGIDLDEAKVFDSLEKNN